MLLRGLAGAIICAVAIAQPYCVANVSQSVPIEIMGSGVISSTTSPLHPDWLGTKITISKLWIDIEDRSNGHTIERLCIDTSHDNSPGGGVLQYELVGFGNLFNNYLICFTVRRTPNGDGTFTLGISFADDKSNKCGTTFDTTVAVFTENQAQASADCPYEGIDGTGLEGWGTPQNTDYFGYTSNGYWESQLGLDTLKWVTTVCLSQVILDPTTNPPEYTLIGENACPTCTCTYGCCIWAAVDHVNKIGWFKAGDTKLVTDCPTSWIGYQPINNWVEGDPSPVQPSSQLTASPTASNTPTSSLTPSTTPSTSLSSTQTPTNTGTPTESTSATGTPSVSATPYQVTASSLSNGQIAGITAGAAAGSLFLGAAAAGGYFYKKRLGAEPDRQSLLTRVTYVTDF